MDKHEWISRLKTMAAELGEPPTRAAFMGAYRGADYQIVKLFGGWNQLLIASEVETYDDRRSRSARKIDSTIFLKDLETHLDRYEPKTPKEKSKYQRCLFLGDTHFPFINKTALDACIEFAREHQPEVIVQVGDLYDAYSHSKFPRSHNVFTPRQEQEMAREGAAQMWLDLQKACPKARCVQIWGNHDLRPLKRVLESYPAAEDWVAEMMKKLMSFPGVETIEDYRTELHLPGDVMVHHGYMSRPGAHRDGNAGYNFVFGHSHKGHVLFKQIQRFIRWELNVGYLGDAESKGLSYTNQKNDGSTVGWGWLDEWGPRFIPA